MKCIDCEYCEKVEKDGRDIYICVSNDSLHITISKDREDDCFYE